MAVKILPASVGDSGPNPDSGRSPGEGNGNPLQYSCLGNPIDRKAYSGLQSMGSQRVEHDSTTDHTHTHTHTHTHSITEPRVHS